MVGGYDIGGRPGPPMNDLHPNNASDSMRQIGIDGDIVDIQTTQMQYGVNYGRGSNEGTIVSKNSGYIKE